MTVLSIKLLFHLLLLEANHFSFIKFHIFIFVTILLLGLLLRGIFVLFFALIVELVNFVLLNNVRLQFPHLLSIKLQAHFLCSCDQVRMDYFIPSIFFILHLLLLLIVHFFFVLNLLLLRICLIRLLLSLLHHQLLLLLLLLHF